VIVLAFFWSPAVSPGQDGGSCLLDIKEPGSRDTSRSSALSDTTWAHSVSHARSSAVQEAGDAERRSLAVTSGRWPARTVGGRSAAPRGALLYPRCSREELGGRFLGLMADLDLKGEGDQSMPGKRWSCPGVQAWGAAGPAEYGESWIA
jgi:hypothetical protein